MASSSDGSSNHNRDSPADSVDLSAFSVTSFYGSTRKRKKQAPEKKEIAIKELRQPKLYKPGILGPSVCWQTFYRQQEAFDFADEKKENDFAVFAFESSTSVEGDRPSGQRRYLVSSRQQFWYHYRDLDPSQRHHYEVIREGSRCKLYFDLEFMTEFNSNADGQTMVDIFIKYVCLWLEECFNIRCDRSSIIDLDASTTKKFSRHLVFQLDSAVFDNCVVAGFFVRHMIAVLLQYIHLKTRKVKHLFNNSSSQQSGHDDNIFTDLSPKANIEMQTSESRFKLSSSRHKLSQEQSETENNSYGSFHDIDFDFDTADDCDEKQLAAAVEKFDNVNLNNCYDKNMVNLNNLDKNRDNIGLDVKNCRNVCLNRVHCGLRLGENSSDTSFVKKNDNFRLDGDDDEDFLSLVQELDAKTLSLDDCDACNNICKVEKDKKKMLTTPENLNDKDIVQRLKDSFNDESLDYLDNVDKITKPVENCEGKVNQNVVSTVSNSLHGNDGVMQETKDLVDVSLISDYSFNDQSLDEFEMTQLAERCEKELCNENAAIGSGKQDVFCLSEDSNAPGSEKQDMFDFSEDSNDAELILLAEECEKDLESDASIMARFSEGGVSDDVLERVCGRFRFEDLQSLIVFDKDGRETTFCDLGVYTKNRNFRLFLSSKLHKNNPLEMSAQNSYRPPRARMKYRNSSQGEEDLFMASLISVPESEIDDSMRILHFGPSKQMSTRPRPIWKEGHVSGGPPTTNGYSASPFPKLDAFITSLVSGDSRRGIVRMWRHCTDRGVITYSITGYRWCSNIGREHRSNNIFYTVDLGDRTYTQGCYDADCARSQRKVEPLPAALTFETKKS